MVANLSRLSPNKGTTAPPLGSQGCAVISHNLQTMAQDASQTTVVRWQRGATQRPSGNGIILFGAWLIPPSDEIKLSFAGPRPERARTGGRPQEPPVPPEL